MREIKIKFTAERVGENIRLAAVLGKSGAFVTTPDEKLAPEMFLDCVCNMVMAVKENADYGAMTDVNDVVAGIKNGGGEMSVKLMDVKETETTLVRDEYAQVNQEGEEPWPDHRVDVFQRVGGDGMLYVGRHIDEEGMVADGYWLLEMARALDVKKTVH